jgi:chemosensory pili system protein ChpC
MTDTEPDLPSLAPVECALLALSGRRLQLLVPLNAIAEVVEEVPLAARDAHAAWLLGWACWRELEIPLLDYAAIGGEPGPPGDRARRMVVIKTLGGTAPHNYYGLAIQDPPKPLRLGADSDLTAREVPPPKGAVLLVDIGGEPALIPDFELLEALARQAPAKPA